MQSWIRNSVIVAISGGLLVALSGCASGEEPHAEQQESSSSAPKHRTREANRGPSARLPIARYSLTDEEAVLLSRAERRLIGACMKRYGLPYEEATVDPPGLSDRRYGLADRVEAQNSGYHPPEFTGNETVKQAQESMPVLMGQVSSYQGKPVPSGGCVEEAGRRVQGAPAPQDAVQAATEISRSSFEESRSDPGVRKVVSAWSQCMKSKGYSYPSPADSAAAFVEKAEVTREEKRAATADVSCKDETGLIDIWLRVETRIQEEELMPRRELLSVLEKRHRQQVEGATAILSSTESPNGS